MRLNILIGGKAGQGLNEMAAILTRAIADSGIYVFNYREYGSWIEGGHNFNILCISDRKTGSFDYAYDIALALDEETLRIHKKHMKKNCIILSEKNIKVENKKIENMYFSGALFKILGLDKKFLLSEIEKKFKGKKLYEEDVKAINESYERDYKFELKIKTGDGKKVLNGSEAVAFSAIESGLNAYFGYPMTPATGVLTLLAQNQQKHGFFVFEPENEIAVINSALGASFAGALAMVGTSGGGFDLMTEALSMSGMTELPLVIHLAQRGSSSTGLPTYTGQSNLNVALYGGNGEYARVVIAPGDSKEAYEKTREGFYFSEKFGIPSIILTDKHLAESDFSFESLEKSNLKIPLRKKFPGDGIFRKNSYEHDEDGHITEEPEKVKRSIEKRVIEKIKEVRKEAEKFETYKTYGKGKKIIVSFGSNKGSILDALQELENFKFLHVIYLEPFPEEIKKELENAERVYCLEANATGQLASLIRAKTGFEIEEKNKILKYDGRAFTPREILERLGRKEK